MRSLRECLTSSGLLHGADPGEAVAPVALLSSVVRQGPAFDPHHTFDLDLFGVDASQASTLGPVVAPLCEVVYEAFELSGVPMESLGSYRIGTFAAQPDPHRGARWQGHEPAEIHERFGLTGPVLLQGGEARALASLHIAGTALRAHEIDLALCLGELDPGVVAILLGRLEQARSEGWRIEHQLASAIGGEAPLLGHLAAQRAGCALEPLQASPSPGLQGLAERLGVRPPGPELLEDPGGAALVLCPPGVRSEPARSAPPPVLGLSARSEGALRALARATSERLCSEADLVSVASDATTRPIWEHRLALSTVEGVRDVRRRLSGWLSGEPGSVYRATHGRARLALIAPARIDQVERADFLYGTEAVFRGALQRCDRLLSSQLGVSLLSAMFPPAGWPPTVGPELEAPLTVALAWSLARLLAAKGARPHAILGLGTGELAAGAIAGRLSIEEALAASAGGDAPALAPPGDGPVWISGATAGPVKDTLPPRSAISAPEPGLEALEALGCDTFVELAMRSDGPSQGDRTRLCPVGTDDAHFAEFLAALWARGVPVTTGAVRPPPGHARLPTYPWDRDTLRPQEASRPTQPPLERSPTLIAPLSSSESEESLLLSPSCSGPPPSPALRPSRTVPRSPNREEVDPPVLDGVSPAALDQPNLPRANRPTPPSDTAPPTIELEELGLPVPSEIAAPPAWAEEQADTRATHVELWRPDPLPELLSEPPPGTWVILADRRGIGDYVSRLLEQRGQQVSKVRHLPGAYSRGHALVIDDPTSTSSWRRVGDLLLQGDEPRRVLHLWSLEDGFEATGWVGLLALAEHLHRRRIRARIQLVTQGAATRPWGDDLQGSAALWGAGRLLAAELPELSGGMIDLDPHDENPSQLLRQLLAEPDDGIFGGEVALRGSQRLRRTIVPCSALPPPRCPPLAGAWILAGQLDGALAQLARILVASGVHKLLLISSTPPTPESARAVLGLRHQGIAPVVLQADLTLNSGRERLRAHLRTDRVAGVVFRTGVDPGSCRGAARLGAIHRPGPVAGFAGELALATALERLAGGAPLWIWSEGRALDPRPGSGAAAITGASLGAFAAARLAAGHPTTVIHADPADTLRSGQAPRLVGRLGPSGGMYGVWAPQTGSNGVPGA